MSSDYEAFVAASGAQSGVHQMSHGASGSACVLSFYRTAGKATKATERGTPPPSSQPCEHLWCLSYSDFLTEYYELEFTYDTLRSLRDSDATKKGSSWCIFLSWLATSLKDAVVSWVGSLEIKAGRVELVSVALPGSSMVLELQSQPALTSQNTQGVGQAKIASLGIVMATQMEQMRGDLTDAENQVHTLKEALAEERRLVAAMQQQNDVRIGLGIPGTLESMGGIAGVGPAGGGGGGVGGTQAGAGMGSQLAGSKRKIQSLVNPTERVRRPRGTKLGGS